VVIDAIDKTDHTAAPHQAGGEREAMDHAVSVVSGFANSAEAVWTCNHVHETND